MSLFSRMKRVTSGKLELFLSKSEDPEVVFPQLIAEMEDQVRAATEAEAKAMAAAKHADRAVEETRGKLDKMTAGAGAALRQGDEAMAREAVEAQVALEAELIRREAARQAAEDSLADARAARRDTQDQLKDVRGKKDEILTRARVVRTQEKVERTVSGPTASTGSILDAVTAMEAKVEEKEANLSVRREMAGAGGGGGENASLERRVDDMNRQTEVDRRLAELKAGLKSKEGSHADS